MSAFWFSIPASALSMSAFALSMSASSNIPLICIERLWSSFFSFKSKFLKNNSRNSVVSSISSSDAPEFFKSSISFWILSSSFCLSEILFSISSGFLSFGSWDTSFIVFSDSTNLSRSLSFASSILTFATFLYCSR